MTNNTGFKNANEEIATTIIIVVGIVLFFIIGFNIGSSNKINILCSEKQYDFCKVAKITYEEK